MPSIKRKVKMNNKYHSFTTLISKINRNIIKIKSREMKIKGLKSTHVSCLYYLYLNEEDNLTAKDLCLLCDEDKGAVSRSISFLLENNYLSCDFEGKKAYKSPLILTEKGRKIGKYISEKIDEIADKGSFGIDEEKRKVLYECLNIISTNLEKISEGDK